MSTQSYPRAKYAHSVLETKIQLLLSERASRGLPLQVSSDEVWRSLTTNEKTLCVDGIAGPDYGFDTDAVRRLDDLAFDRITTIPLYTLHNLVDAHRREIIKDDGEGYFVVTNYLEKTFPDTLYGTYMTPHPAEYILEQQVEHEFSEI